MTIFREKYAKDNHNRKMMDKSLAYVSNFKYYGTTLTNHNSILK